MMILSWLSHACNRFSFLGLLLGGIFFAMSLTPSLIPRDYLFQGALAGLCFALGYGSGVSVKWLWEFFELPEPKIPTQTIAKAITTFAVISIVIYSLWRSLDWQNAIRQMMNMPLLDTGNPTRVALVAIVIALILILIGWWIGAMIRFAYQKLQRVVPSRVALIIGPLIVAVLLVNLVNGVIVTGLLRMIDASYASFDRIFDDRIAAPQNPLQSGSPASLVAWQDLGHAGRSFVVSGPDAAQISAFSGRDAKQPIRLYVGLNSAETFEERGDIALAELKRVNAFDRKLLIVATPTGTGWIDPMGADPVEYLHDGDIATVAVQYSYLSSPISLLAEPGRSRESARAVFHVIYNHWKTLPKDTRPELYLSGLSLGSHGSEASLELYKMLGDPIQGALWAGPPFPNEIHSSVTRDRNEGSPAWLPVFQDSSLFRFTSQTDKLDIPGASWGPLRIVYLQYASDPIVFFDLAGAFRRPVWMRAGRGPDVWPGFTWYPVVTFFQLLLDMGIATSVPFGFGHNYAAEHYIDGWVAVTAPEGWGDAEVERLQALFADARTADQQ